MNIGGAMKLLQSLDPKKNAGVLGAITKEMKLNKEMQGMGNELSAAAASLLNSLGSLGSDMDKLNGAMKAKPKASEEDEEAVKKQVAKMMKDWQASRVKRLEDYIAKLEKQLAALRKQLADAKGSKPEGWFM